MEPRPYTEALSLLAFNPNTVGPTTPNHGLQQAVQQKHDF